MISMQGVPSSLIARNESWVRKQATALVRRLPANVEKADLIQVGLIAVAQSALGFEWVGDKDCEEAREAFVRYARLRVKGAMIDELRQMDHLGRADRRKLKVVHIARERWHDRHDMPASLSDLSLVCGMDVDEIARLECDALLGQPESLGDDSDDSDRVVQHQAATPADEVEARVDTAILMRRLESFFVTLPERDREVIDAYLGVGLTPMQLADSWRVTPSRVSQMYSSVCSRIALHLHPGAQRVTDNPGSAPAAAVAFDALVASREAELPPGSDASPWAVLLERALTLPKARFSPRGNTGRLPADT